MAVVGRPGRLHRGRRTGKLRTTPLVYLQDADRVVVVASQAGRRNHPLWFRNLEADPHVRIRFGRRWRSGVASVVSFLAACVVTLRCLEDLPYHAFITGNASVRSAPSQTIDA